MQSIEIGRNAAVYALGDALAAFEPQVLVARIVDAGNFRKHRRHVSAGQNDEGRLLIPRSGWSFGLFFFVGRLLADADSCQYFSSVASR